MKIHQSGDKIIVTELRTVSYVPQGGMVLISKNGMLRPGVNAGGGFVRFMDENYCGANIEDCDGWIPMPEYQPNSASNDKAALYEKIRKLNPRQFGELYERHLRGDGNFDELVSRLP